MGKLETQVSDEIRLFLEDHGYIVFRMQSGRFRGAGGWVTMNPKGTPDLIAICKATRCATFVEVKKDDGVTSEEQKRFQEAYSALGGTSLIVYSLGDLIQKLTIM